MTADLVSIYMPTKNRVGLLRRAVESILAQTVRNIELIVVSDGSTDETCEYVNSIKSDIRVRLIHNEQSQGACTARNQALAIAEGRFVTGLDDDDYFLPNRIADFLSLWKQLEQQQVHFSCLFDSITVGDGVRTYVLNSARTVTIDQMRSTNQIGSQVFTTRERLAGIGGFDAKMPAWQDWDTWVRLLETYGPAISIQKTSYFADASHDFERITQKSPEKILNAAALFYAKHCTRKNLPGILLSLANYPQVKFSVADIGVLIGDSQWRVVARQVLRGNYRLSLSSSVPSMKTMKNLPSSRA